MFIGTWSQPVASKKLELRAYKVYITAIEKIRWKQTELTIDTLYSILITSRTT